MDYHLCSVCRDCETFNISWGLCSKKELDQVIDNYLASKNKIRCSKCREWVDFKLIINKKDNKGIWVEDRILDRKEIREKSQEQQIVELVNSL